MKTFNVSTSRRCELIDITSKVEKAIQQEEIKEGICIVFVPHTTAGITINENADPSVQRDILNELNKIVPFDDNYSHMEGNAAAHIKASLLGSSVTILIEDGALQLGTWQGIYFAEFDGPRARKVLMKIISNQ
ncbi:MAG: YjbQ family protein [Candidatus Omnitrophica bacterium]|nr:YjbQ family protein [Candidatus Omnitrophota bacterium]